MTWELAFFVMLANWIVMTVNAGYAMRRWQQWRRWFVTLSMLHPQESVDVMSGKIPERRLESV